MVIVTRPFDKKLDTGFIVDSMPKDIYYDNKQRRNKRDDPWFKTFHTNLLSLLDQATTVIATMDDNPEFIMGYAIFKDKSLEFIHVKDAYRKQGIATMLANAHPYDSINESNMTKLGKKILEQKLAQPTKEIPLTIQEEQTMQLSQLDSWIKTGLPIKKAIFPNAILSGFNAAEFQLSTDSSNKLRCPQAMWLTPAGVIIKQNDQYSIVPLANVTQVVP